MQMVRAPALAVWILMKSVTLQGVDN